MRRSELLLTLNHRLFAGNVQRRDSADTLAFCSGEMQQLFGSGALLQLQCLEWAASLLLRLCNSGPKLLPSLSFLGGSKRFIGALRAWDRQTDHQRRGWTCNNPNTKRHRGQLLTPCGSRCFAMASLAAYLDRIVLACVSEQESAALQHLLRLLSSAACSEGDRHDREGVASCASPC